MDVKDKKLIVNIPAEDLKLFEGCAKLENRSRNNFIMNSAYIRANKILSSKNSEEILN